jgi:hypothetical protein
VAKCESVDVLKETLIEASGDPLVKPAAAVELKRQLAADAYIDAQEAANDAATGLAGPDDTARVKAAQDEAKALFKAQTGLDLDVMDTTKVKQDATASSIADAARACAAAGSYCTDSDAVIEKAADTASGDMPAVKAAANKGGRRLARVTKDSTKDEKKKAAKRMREKKFGALQVIKERVDACLEAGKDDATIKACRDDDDVKNVRSKIRPSRKGKADNREQRANAAIDTLADCKRAGSTVKDCEAKAKKKAKYLFPKKAGAAAGDETEESWESMKGKRKKERMRRAVQDCGKGKESLCETAAKDDLTKDLGVDVKEIAMIKRQTAPMMAADVIAECEDAIHLDKAKIDAVDAGCEGLGKDIFMATGSTEMAWKKHRARIVKMAKLKFAGEDIDVEVNQKEVDTFFEADSRDGKCDTDMIERARKDIGNAAKKGDPKGKGETVMQSQGVDSASSKCRVVFATKVTEGKHEEAAASINEAKEVGKEKGKRLRNLAGGADGSVSASPTSKEVPHGETSEPTDFSSGEINSDGDSGSSSGNGGLDLIGYIAVGAGVLLLVGAVAGFVYVRSITKDGTSTPPHVELTGGKPDLFDDPFEGRGRVNSLNPLEDNVMYSNPMER